MKVKDNIPLTRRLRKSWRGSNVIIFPTTNTILVKRVQKTEPTDFRQQLKALGKKVTVKDISSAIRAARA